MEIKLFEEIENIVATGEIQEEISILLRQTEFMSGENNTEIWKSFLKKLSQWKKQYLLTSDSITLYGYMTWYLDISIKKYHYPVDIDEKTYILQLMLLDFFADTSDMTFREDSDIYERLEMEFFDLVEFQSCRCISKDEFLSDLHKYYKGSKERFKSWKVKYHGIDLAAKLEHEYEKYKGYIKVFRGLSDKSNILRVNQLGICENGSSYPTEISMYFILDSNALYVLTLSDFA